MCGIFFTNKNINSFDVDYVIEYLKKRGPDSTNIKCVNGYTIIHTLLSMTGPLTEQPFFSEDEKIICIFNGEIYNFKEYGNYESDGECLIPLYEKYGDEFVHKLDGEFSLILVDFLKNILIISTDIFGTRPLWIGFDGKDFGIATYKSCLDRINIHSNFQILANKTYIIDLIEIKILEEKRVNTFDLRQYKTNFDDWNNAFSNAIQKRVKYAKCGIFIGMSGGYDSGAIACELTKQNVDFSAYSIVNTEDINVMNKRAKIIKKPNIIELSRNDFLKARDYLKENAQEYTLNIDNGEKDKYDELVNKRHDNLKTLESLMKTIEFRKHGQILTDDNGAIGCSYICSLAKQKNEKIYLSGSGADEIFSDYGFNKIKYYNHSTIGGYFPEDLNTVFPWKNFFGNTQRAYLMKEEHVAGSYGIEGRYPFLDRDVVQEFLWLSPELKNGTYKAPLDNYLSINNFPYEKNQKIGFGCGFSGPSADDISFKTLTDEQKMNAKTRKVTDHRDDLLVDIEKLANKKTKSYENFYLLNKKDIQHVANNCYRATININYPGTKYWSKSRYTLQENGNSLRAPVISQDMIKNGDGLYCFWTANSLYFSTSDNSDPRTNGKDYTIIKLNDNLKKLVYMNGNIFNTKKYYIAIVLNNCKCDTMEYLKVREILNYYNYIPNVLICDDYQIFMDLPNITFSACNRKNEYLEKSRVIIEDINNADIDDIRTRLFDVNNFENNYEIIKGNDPSLTLFIMTICNSQFKYTFESVLSQDIDCKINIVKNMDAVDANNAIIDRCTTKYYIQVDEDMIFYTKDSALKMYNMISKQNNNIWQYCYSLKDHNFGVDAIKRLLGIKIFNHDLIIKHDLRYVKENDFALDRVIQEKSKLAGLENMWTTEQIGYHQKYAKPLDIFLRCAKIGYELINPVSNWGNYEYGIFMRYITMYDFETLLMSVIYIISRLDKKPDIFFSQIKLIQTPEYFLKNIGANKTYHINETHLDNFEKLKSTKIIPIIDSNMIKKDTTYYCLAGFIYPHYYNYNFNYEKYPYDLFREKIL